jgi:hypothetical protein
MKRIETWNGRQWIECPIEKMPLGQYVVKVTDVPHPTLDLDILKPLEKYINAESKTRKPNLLQIIRRDGGNT